jgi:DNA-binding response OmpR family regulator
MAHELDTLQMALLSVCHDTREPMHTLHAHAEDWLSRPIGSDELDQAIDAMERAGLIAAYRLVESEWVLAHAGAAPAADLRFLATPMGAQAVATAWQRFFSE